MQFKGRVGRCVVLAAFRVEVELLAQRLEEPGVLMHDGLLTYVVGRLMGRELLVGTTGVRKVRAAAATERAIDLFKPDFILFCGTAGSLDPAIRPLDLVVADRVAQHDTGPGEPDLIATDPAIVKHLHDAALFALDGDGAVHSGTLLSGDRPVLDGILRARLAERFEAKAVDMEAAAAAVVARSRDLPLGVIKAITDSADSNGTSDFKKNVKQGAARVQHAVVRFLTGGDDSSND